MKKYLMTAMAAVAMGVAFTSCSHNTDLYGGEEGSGKINGRTAQEQIELDKAVYKAAFEKTFGKVAPTVDWGFGSGTRAFTRAQDQDYPATSEGINANANEWADPNKRFGGWIVPDPLTEGQKLRVKAYFQANPDLDYIDPEWRHFFVQQVYKGATSVGANSTEKVIAANNSEYTSSNMNLMTVGANHQHINNFNGGDCSERSDVLNNDESVGGASHSDKIMLMVNIDDTSCFGYHETGSSTHHDNKAALVSAAEIDRWAAANGNIGEAVTDDWNRSFLGFDLAIKEGAEAYATNDATGEVIYATYAQAPESPRYAWDGEKVIEIAEQSAATGWQVVYKAGYENLGVGYLTTNQNFYQAADKVTLQQTISINRAQLSSLEGIQNCVVLKEVMDGNQWYQGVINLPRINQLIADGYLPVMNTSLTNWVKVGKSDGYFSDWIVTLTRADRIDEKTVKTTYRVIAEDLNASQASDFDFNDVVFDVEPNEAGTAANIILRAAGGIYELRVAGIEVHEAFDPSLAGTESGKYPMINTQPWDENKKVTLVENYKGDFSKDNIRNTIKDIKITVTKPEYDEVNAELTAETGKPTCKILVDQTFKVVTERKGIADENTNFHKYVNGTFQDAFWWKKD